MLNHVDRSMIDMNFRSKLTLVNFWTRQQIDPNHGFTSCTAYWFTLAIFTVDTTSLSSSQIGTLAGSSSTTTV